MHNLPQQKVKKKHFCMSLHKRMHAVRCIEMCSFQVVRCLLRWEPNFCNFRAVDMRRFGNRCSAEWLSNETRVALAHIIVLPSFKEMVNFYTSLKKTWSWIVKRKVLTLDMTRWQFNGCWNEWPPIYFSLRPCREISLELKELFWAIRVLMEGVGRIVH